MAPLAPPVILLYVYGALLLAGGLMGYIKARSVPSLVAGGICGLLAILLAYFYTWHFAPHVAFVLSLALLFIIGRRYLRTRQPMPALLIVILSVIVAVVQIYVLVVVGAGSDRL